MITPGSVIYQCEDIGPPVLAHRIPKEEINRSFPFWNAGVDVYPGCCANAEDHFQQVTLKPGLAALSLSQFCYTSWLPSLWCAPCFSCFSKKPKVPFQVCVRARALEAQCIQRAAGRLHTSKVGTQEKEMTFLLLILESWACHPSSCRASDLTHTFCVTVSRSFVLKRVL